MLKSIQVSSADLTLPLTYTVGHPMSSSEDGLAHQRWWIYGVVLSLMTPNAPNLSVVFAVVVCIIVTFTLPCSPPSPTKTLSSWWAR